MEEVSLQCRIKKKSNTQKVIKEREGERSREQEEGDEGEEWRERGVGGGGGRVVAPESPLPLIAEVEFTLPHPIVWL